MEAWLAENPDYTWAKVVAETLKKALNENLDVHQHRGEYVEGCLQCEKCKLIREIASSFHNENINNAVFGKSPRRGTKAYWTTTSGERLLMRDDDMRVSAKARKGRIHAPV